MMQEVPNQYEIKQSPDNENRTLEQLKPWEKNVDKKDEYALRHIEGTRNFFENNKDVANQFKRNRDKLFTSEYSTNDADSRFAERLSRLE